MTLLRHPVVITSLEEDFRVIGLISEERRDEDDEQSVDELDDAEDVAEDDDEADEADEAMAEAVAYYEDFQAEWQRMGEAGVEAFDVDQVDMEELESFAEEVTELPLDVIGVTLDEDDEADDEDEEIDEDDVDDADATEALEAVAQEMSAIRTLLDADVSSQSLAEAVPAFANLALIAEKLYGFFEGLSKSQGDEAHLEISEAYAGIAKEAAAMVELLQTEDHDELDAGAVSGAFREYLAPVLKGLETYSLYREADDQEDDESDDDEFDEGNE